MKPFGLGRNPESTTTPTADGGLGGGDDDELLHAVTASNISHTHEAPIARR
jgi:hypothetical protein